MWQVDYFVRLAAVAVAVVVAVAVAIVVVVVLCLVDCFSWLATRLVRQRRETPELFWPGLSCLLGSGLARSGLVGSG